MELLQKPDDQIGSGESVDFNERLQLIENICQYYAFGKELYDALSKNLEESPGVEVIVSPANLGDTVFIATLSSAYKSVHNIDKLIIVAKKRQAEAAEWFEGVDSAVGLSDYEMWCLRYYFTISRKFYLNGIRYGHIPCIIDLDYPETFFHIPPGFGGESLIRIWESRILDLPYNSSTCDITVPEDYKVDENVEKYRDSILIAPAAFTNTGIPDSFWEKLVNSLKQRGFMVYCNSGGLYYDKVISGSVELVLRTRELILSAEYFRHIIGVRSGFTDLVSKTNARLSVMHLGGTLDLPLRIEYGSVGDDVRDLGRIKDIFPMRYCPEREDEIIQLIIEDIQ